MARGLYKIPNARLEVRRVYTNNIPGGQMRAPAEPQGVFAAESHIDCVARAIGMDPLEFRLHNLIEEGDETVAGDHYRDVRARETLEAAAEGANYASPTPAGVGRGIAMGYRSPGGGESAIAVSLNQDGSVVIGTPVFDQGTGTYTTLRQVVSEELRYPAEEIAIEVLDTDHTAFDSGIGGSRGTHITTGSAYQAASEAREELARLVSEALEWPEDEIELDGRDAVRRTTGERRPWRGVLERVGRSVRAEAVYKKHRAGAGDRVHGADRRGVGGPGDGRGEAPPVYDGARRGDGAEPHRASGTDQRRRHAGDRVRVARGGAGGGRSRS